MGKNITSHTTLAKSYLDSLQVIAKNDGKFGDTTFGFNIKQQFSECNILKIVSSDTSKRRA